MTPISAFLLSFALVAECLSVPAARAQESPAFDRIRQTGAFVIGYRDSGVPFSFYDENNRPVGYGVDICLRITDAIKSESWV